MLRDKISFEIKGLTIDKIRKIAINNRAIEEKVNKRLLKSTKQFLVLGIDFSTYKYNTMNLTPPRRIHGTLSRSILLLYCKRKTRLKYIS